MSCEEEESEAEEEEELRRENERERVTEEQQEVCCGSHRGKKERAQHSLHAHALGRAVLSGVEASRALPCPALLRSSSFIPSLLPVSYTHLRAHETEADL
eukprot:1758003-Rhodomonas_salina.1